MGWREAHELHANPEPVNATSKEWRKPMKSAPLLLTLFSLVLSSAASSPALADELTYSASFDASGTLNGLAFTNRQISIDGTTNSSGRYYFNSDIGIYWGAGQTPSLCSSRIFLGRGTQSKPCRPSGTLLPNRQGLSPSTRPLRSRPNPPASSCSAQVYWAW